MGNATLRLKSDLDSRKEGGVAMKGKGCPRTLGMHDCKSCTKTTYMGLNWPRRNENRHSPHKMSLLTFNSM